MFSQTGPPQIYWPCIQKSNLSGSSGHFSASLSIAAAVELLLLHPFNGLFSRTTWVSWHQKGKPFWILLQQEIMGWQQHQLDHMQIICTLLQTDNHASTLPHSFYRSDALPATQPTASKH